MEERKKIGIIAAMSCEIDILKAELEEPQVKIIAGTEFHYGRIGKYDVGFLLCGMGKVGAAIGAQAMITAYEPDYIINTGCAGALSDSLDVGDMVIAAQTVEWDLDTIDIGNPRGFVTALGKIRMDADEWLSVELEKIIGDNAKIVRGLVVSGDQFVDKPEQKALIHDSFPDALCAEMEGAAIGHVCQQNKVPFCVIRCMSDNANGDSGVNFAEFAPMAGEKSAKYLLKFLQQD